MVTKREEWYICSRALGITSLERHFTLDRTMQGSDQSASLTAKGFKERRKCKENRTCLKGSSSK